jgi:DNA primase
LIYWQSRSITSDVKPRYKNCYAPKDAVIYGYDKLFSYSTAPLFVTEGVFDAEGIDGICILGSSLNAAKIEILHKTKRRIIFVVDRDSNGGDLGNEVIKQGWELTFVDPNVEDVNDSIVKYGKIYTTYCLMKNATNKNDKSRDQKLELDLELSFSKLRKSKYI